MKYHRLKNKDYEDESFKVEGSVINYSDAVIDPIEQQSLNLSKTDKAFIRYFLNDAEELLKEFLDEKKNLSNYTAEDLDELLFLWNNKKINFKYFEEAQLVNAIGAAFGVYLNKVFGTKWAVVGDNYIADYACVFGKEYSNLLFPFIFVRNIVEEKQEDALNATVLMVKKNIEDRK